MTKSQEDYIETIYMLFLAKRPARIRDIARCLNVKTPSVVKAVSELKSLGLVIQEPYGSVELTEAGFDTAKNVLLKHSLLKKFLILLGVTPEIADEDACKMEHILSAETLDRITEFVTERLGKSACQENSDELIREAVGIVTDSFTKHPRKPPKPRKQKVESTQSAESAVPDARDESTSDQ
ncbi:MAG: metal-dependent transcriptional regulator [Kiritimatiellae bacterium]|nr:metal-dependent transcriptional regulator [Kiritimatiellia bacterium]